MEICDMIQLRSRFCRWFACSAYLTTTCSRMFSIVVISGVCVIVLSTLDAANSERGERASANVEDDDKGEDRKKSWDLDGLWRRLEAAVERGELTAEEARERYAVALEKADVEEDDDVKLREFRKAVVQRAMALPPEEWSDELKRAILRAGWDLAEFTEGVRLRQQKSQDGDAQRGERASANVEDDSPNAISGESIAEPETAVKQSSWGQVKRKSVRTE